MKTVTGTTLRRHNLPILFAAVASSFLAPQRRAVLNAKLRAQQEPKPRALIIDSESGVRQLLSLCLGEMGLEVATVGNAAEARPLIERGLFDIVVLDWVVDGAEGLNLLHLSKTQHPDIPVIIFTNAAPVQESIEGGPASKADAVARKRGPLGALCTAIYRSLGWDPNRLRNVA